MGICLERKRESEIQETMLKGVVRFLDLCVRGRQIPGHACRGSVGSQGQYIVRGRVPGPTCFGHGQKSKITWISRGWGFWPHV